jgi:hypothetical protein
MSTSQKDHLKDEGSRLQTTAAGATAGLIARYALDHHHCHLSDINEKNPF